MGHPRKIKGRPPTKERILAAAEHAFAEYGFAGVRLSQVAAEAGIRAPSLLYYFPTKVALYDAVTQGVFLELERAVLEGIESKATLEQQVAQLADTLITLASTRRAFLRLVVREMLSPNTVAAPAVEGLRRVVDGVTEFLVARGAGVQDIPVREAVMQLTSAFLLRGAATSFSTLWTDRPAAKEMAMRLLLGESSAEQTQEALAA